MSGIFGVFDPRGVDPDLVLRAAGTLAYRGQPTVATKGPVTLGVLGRDGSGRHGLVETAGSLLVTDARAHAVRVGSQAARVSAGHAGATALDACLAELGPQSLIDHAADFVLARFDRTCGELFVCRDALGTRPLFWARREDRFAFASDPAFLWATGVASEVIDVASVASYLAIGDTIDERTAFRDVRRVGGGCWVSVTDAGRSISTGRWFIPEDVDQQPWRLGQAAARLRGLLIDAVHSRCVGETVALCLTGGRDSGAIAIALAEAGIKATCLTATFPPGVADSEAAPARELAQALGHDWREVPVTVRPSDAQMAELPEASGTPFGIQPITLAFGLLDAVRDVGATVVVDGEGGEPLFAAAPVAVWDLARNGHIGLGVRAARAYHEEWTSPYSAILKSLFRATAPRPFLHRRERMRPRAPWLQSDPDAAFATNAPRSARSHLSSLLREIGMWTNNESWERACQRIGATSASPFYDLRILRFGLSLPVELRVPVPEPKPLLARALLGKWAGSRIKASQSGYFAALGRSLAEDHPLLFRSGGHLGKVGISLVGELGGLDDPRWSAQVPALVALDTWLEARERDGRREAGL